MKKRFIFFVMAIVVLFGVPPCAYDAALEGKVAAWGWNFFGQCNVPGGNDFVAIAGSWYNSLALVCPPYITVTIDIKPGGDPNSINLGDHGLLPVAILGTPEFDVTTINPETIDIGGVFLAERGSQKAPKIAYSLEDVDGDGYIDMMTFFDVQELVSIGTLTGGTTELLLSAALDDDTQIEGSDSVNIVH